MSNPEPTPTIASLNRAYLEGQLSPVEATRHSLDAIDRLDDTLGAFQVVYRDEALADAERAEAVLRSGTPIGPFFGIPFALKDIIDLEDRVTTGGSHPWRTRVSTQTATIAQRLFDAGGILIGKTKTVEVARGGWGTNQYMGTPWNPWDPDIARIPGGSSSGSAVAVAAGLVPAAIGTDTGGSVRLPAAFCGLVGLKTTEGLLPTDGIIPLAHSLDTVGPMTRTVEDAAVMLDVLAEQEPTVLETSVVGLRLAQLNAQERQGVDQAVLDRYDEAIEALRQLGAQVLTLDLPLSFAEIEQRAYVISSAEAYHHHGARFEDPTAHVDEDVRARVLLGRDLTITDYIEATRARSDDQASYLRALGTIDAVLTPTVETPPIPVVEVDQVATPARFTRLANHLALCGLSVPAGLTADGLPVGLQILGRGGAEPMVLGIGAAFESARGPLPLPPIHA